jgi:hypothetical protein
MAAQSVILSLFYRLCPIDLLSLLRKSFVPSIAGRNPAKSDLKHCGKLPRTFKVEWHIW